METEKAECKWVFKELAKMDVWITECGHSIKDSETSIDWKGCPWCLKQIKQETINGVSFKYVPD